jgi:DNA-binding winged helix-turn-helix (wHTH) protein
MPRTLTQGVRRAPGRFTPAKQWGNIRFVRSVPMEVVIVRWPAERERREQLRRGGRPRILLLDDGASPPDPDDCLEDWARASIDEVDLRARVVALERRATFHDRSAPVLDGDGVLHHPEAGVALPPVEARLMTALLERSGAVVSRDALARAGWPEGAPGRNALDVHVLRLRRRVDPLGLVIRTVRSRGYLLESATRHMATMA